MEDGSFDVGPATTGGSSTGSDTRPLAVAGGLLLAFAQPILAFLVVFARAAGALAEGGSGATDLVTFLFGVQLLTVPIGLLILGWGLRLSRAGEWVLLFLVGIPLVFVLSFFGQFQMCGVVGEYC